MKSFIRSAVTLVLLIANLCVKSQAFTNNGFSSGGTGWGCLPEIGAETIYGGSIAGNNVAEIDGQPRHLCQTVSGFIPGNVYLILLSASRRTTCGIPNPFSINLFASGGALSATITRTNTTFSLTASGFTFTALSASHTFSLLTQPGYTFGCGMIVDDIDILTTSLPIELMSFSSNGNVDSPLFSWSTATEKNNDYFELERSGDGMSYHSVARVASKARPTGTSSSRLDYSVEDALPNENESYYRLKQIDRDKSFSYSKVLYVSTPKEESGMSIYPNPVRSGEKLMLAFDKVPSGLSASLSDMLGTVFPVRLNASDKATEFSMDTEGLVEGMYVLRVGTLFRKISVVR